MVSREVKSFDKTFSCLYIDSHDLQTPTNKFYMLSFRLFLETYTRIAVYINKYGSPRWTSKFLTSIFMTSYF